MRIGERLRLGLRLPPESVDGLFRVEARLTGLDQTGADVQFLDPPPPFQAALKAYLGVLDGLQAQLDQQERAYADRLAALDRASRNGAGLMGDPGLAQLPGWSGGGAGTAGAAGAQ